MTDSARWCMYCILYGADQGLDKVVTLEQSALCDPSPAVREAATNAHRIVQLRLM